MKQKIVFPTLVANLAIQSGKSKKQCEDFLRELFGIIEEELTVGESVKIKGLGTFKLINVDPRKSVDVNTGEDIEIPGHKKVTFIPAKELSERINEPFSMFESVELPDDVQPGSYNNIDTENTSPLDIENSKKYDEQPNIEDTEVQLIQEQLTEPENDPEQTIPEINTESNPVCCDDSDSYEYYEETPAPSKRFRFLWGFISGITLTLVILMAAFFLLGGEIKNILDLKSSLNKETPTISNIEKGKSKENQDTVASDIHVDSAKPNAEVENAVLTMPSDVPVYDTISRTRYLTTMAKEHYGNYNLWPYIYIENQKILGHPDRIKPGTRVVIPSLSKYGVNASDPEDIRRAKSKGVEIYSRYQ